MEDNDYEYVGFIGFLLAILVGLLGIFISISSNSPVRLPKLTYRRRYCYVIPGDIYYNSSYTVQAVVIKVYSNRRGLDYTILYSKYIKRGSKWVYSDTCSMPEGRFLSCYWKDE